MQMKRYQQKLHNQNTKKFFYIKDIIVNLFYNGTLSINNNFTLKIIDDLIIDDIFISPNEELLICLSVDHVYFFNISQSVIYEIKRMKYLKKYIKIPTMFSKNGNFFIATENEIEVYDKNCNFLYKIEDEKIKNVIFSNCGKFIYYACIDNIIKKFNFENKEIKELLKIDLLELCISPCDNFLLILSQGEIHFFNLEKNKTENILEIEMENCKNILYSHDGRFISYRFDNEIKIYNKTELVGVFSDKQNKIISYNFAEEDKIIILFENSEVAILNFFELFFDKYLSTFLKATVDVKSNIRIFSNDKLSDSKNLVPLIFQYIPKFILN